jgi:RNA polymerase sigma-70 factor (ECF subfamily)
VAIGVAINPANSSAESIRFQGRSDCDQCDFLDLPRAPRLETPELQLRPGAGSGRMAAPARSVTVSPAMSSYEAIGGAAAFDGRLRAGEGADARVVDAELSADLDRARDGDEAAFSRIFRAVQPALLRYLGALVGADAEDVASEAWAHACRDLARFRGDMDGFRGWVATIARRRAIDHLRACGRRPFDPVPVEQLHERTSGECTDDLALESLATAAAMTAITSLPKDQAEAVLLRTVMGLDAKAAGRVLGKRAGAVRAAAFRGLNNLAARIEADHAPADPPATSVGHNTFPLFDDDEMR